MRKTWLFSAVAVVCIRTAYAEQDPNVQLVHDAAAVGDCKRALEAHQRIPAKLERERILALADARACTLTEDGIADAISMIRVLRDRAPANEHPEFDKVIAAFESDLQVLKGPRGPQIRAHKEAMTAAADLLARGQCYEADKQLDKVPKETRDGSLQWWRLKSKADVCTASAFSPGQLEQATERLQALLRLQPRNKILEEDIELAKQRKDKLAADDKRFREERNQEMGKWIRKDRDQRERFDRYITEGQCNLASQEMHKYEGYERTHDGHKQRARLEICIGTRQSLDTAEQLLAKLETWPQIIDVERKRDEAFVAEHRALLQQKRDALASAEREAKLKRMPELIPSTTGMGFGAELVTYRDMSSDTGFLLDFKTELKTVDLSVGYLASGPETGMSVKAGLHLFAWPRPSLSKFSLIASAGVGWRSWLSDEEAMRESGSAFRYHITAKMRVACSVMLSASYEPALTDGVPDTLGLGLELRLMTDKPGTSVCSR